MGNGNRFFTIYAVVALLLVVGVWLSSRFGTTSVVPPERAYVVRQGEDWEDLANRHGVSVKSLLRANRRDERSDPPASGEVLVLPETLVV